MFPDGTHPETCFHNSGLPVETTHGGDKNCFLFGIATDCKANAKRQNCGQNQGNDYQSILAE